MKTPAFWYDRSFSLTAFVLTPLSSLYETVTGFHRAFASPQKSPLPVICLGNLVAGGSGKTPTAIALSKLLQDSKLFSSPAFVTRGYLGDMVGPECVDPSRGGADMWGDESLLLARHAPTIVAKDRYAGAVYARDTGADLVVLDDGLQNSSVQKDVSFCVIDGMMGFGNGKVIPAGPLRQSLDDGFLSVDAVIFIGDDLRDTRRQIPSGVPVFSARVLPRFTPSGATYIAFCGIGFPEKFLKTIQSLGVTPISFHAFPDHHSFTKAEIDALLQKTEEQGVRLLTTEKDFVRLPEGTPKDKVDVLPIEIVFDDPDSLLTFISKRVTR